MEKLRITKAISFSMFLHNGYGYGSVCHLSKKRKSKLTMVNFTIRVSIISADDTDD